MAMAMFVNKHIDCVYIQILCSENSLRVNASLNYLPLFDKKNMSLLIPVSLGNITVAHYALVFYNQQH